MRILEAAILFLAVAFCVAVPARGAVGRRADVDPTGILWGILHDGELLPVRAEFVVATPEWKTRLGPGNAGEVERSEEEGTRTWSGTLKLKDRPAFRYRQDLREEGGRVHFSLHVESARQADLAGVFLDVKVPAGPFAGGVCELSRGGADADRHPLPAPGSRQQVAAGNVREVRFRAPDRDYSCVLALDRPRRLTVKAHPGWLVPHYRVLVPLHEGGMEAGDTVRARYSFDVAGEAERRPARLRLDLDRERYRLQGFGGNYCFWPNTPTVDYTLENLRPRWARTQMFLMYWEPENDNSDPDSINWDAFEDKEKGMWILQTEMRAAQKMAERDIPFIISCWQLPDWMRVPRSEAQGRRRPIARDKWPEVIESICAYLLYLKRNYDAEPAMFSFNEPQLGRMPDAEHHREFSKRLGARMEELGLKTKILAGDVNTPGRNKIEYPKPLLNDPEGRRYVRGISFHSWGGASPEVYRAWSELARKHNLPLFIGELGWYALAHRSRASRTALYALKELRMYQELLLHARPQVLLEWEYGGSYPLLLERDDELEPTTRYWFIHQFATLTPRPAVALGTASDHPDVLFTGFRGQGKEGQTVYTLHVANLGADRPVRLEGLPSELGRLEATRTGVGEGHRSGEVLRARGGRLTTHLPAMSLVTLRWTE